MLKLESWHKMSRINNNFFLATLIISSLFLLFSCGKDENTAEALIRYHNEDWEELVEMRNEILKGNSSELVYIEETKGKPAGEAYLEEVILYELEIFIEEEKEIDIQDDSVKELHELLIAADEFVYDSFKEHATAYYRGEIDGDEFLEKTKETKKRYGGDPTKLEF